MKKSEKKGDIPLLVAVTALAVFGVIAVYSASHYTAGETYGNPFYYTLKQAAGLFLGLIGMTIAANVDYHAFFKKGKWAYLISLVLLALVFVPFLSVEVYGARRWINLGFFTIQPSELAKFSFVMFAAEYLAIKPERIGSFRSMAVVLIAGGAACALIILEPNMSITVCVAAVMMILLFSSGMKMEHLLAVVVPALLAVPVMIVAEPYRLRRLSAFMDPFASPKGEGYQLLQSLYGLADGGLFGVGLFNSRQKYRFLPFAESDFILSVIGEELGFFGMAIMLAVTLFIVLRGIRIAAKSRDLYGFLLALGIISIYAVQAAVNALVVTGSIPPTGLPLPLVSAGNTSLVIFMTFFGVLYNVSKGGGKTSENTVNQTPIGGIR